MLKWWTDYRLKRLEMELAAKNKPFETILQAVQSQNAILNEWLQGFKVHEMPNSTVVRDRDEWEAEMNREYDHALDEPSSKLQESIFNAFRGGAAQDLREMVEL